MILTTAALEQYKLIRHPLYSGLLILGVCLLSLLFYRLCVDYLSLAQHALQQGTQTSITMDVIKPLCSWTIVILSIILPIFTVLAFSQEFRQKTFLMFAMSGLSASTVVLGKYFNLLVIVVFFIIAIIAMVCSLQFETALNWGLIAFYLTLVFLIGSCLISFGLFISSMMTHSLIAIGLTYLGNCFWLLLQWLNPFPQTYHFLAKEFSLLSHGYRLMHGVFYSPDIVYYFLFTVFWLILTSRVIDTKMKNTQ